MAPGEVLIAVDSGKDRPHGRHVLVAVSARALYVSVGARDKRRVDFSEIASIRVKFKHVIELRFAGGSQALWEFEGRWDRPLPDVIEQQLQRSRPVIIDRRRAKVNELLDIVVVLAEHPNGEREVRWQETRKGESASPAFDMAAIDAAVNQFREFHGMPTEPIINFDYELFGATWQPALTSED